MSRFNVSVPLPLDYAYASIESVCAVAATLGNVLVIALFIKYRVLRTVTNYYVMSLAVADLLVGIVGIPSAIATSIGLPTHFQVDTDFQAAAEGKEMFVPMFFSHPSSCADVLALDTTAESGIYFLWLTGTGQATRMWCDMEAEGGGWTMVYSYKVVDPWRAVDPIPTWPAPQASLPLSTTPISDMHRYGALDFPLWQALGTEFMIKSNHNNWVAWTAGTGSLIEVRDGRVNCRLIRSVTTQCPDLNLTPTQDWHIKYVGRGVVLMTTSSWANLYYYFEGKMDNHFPTHDPCGKDNYQNIFYKFILAQIWLC